MHTQVGKIKKLREMCDAAGVDPWIEVDGGITPANAHQASISMCQRHCSTTISHRHYLSVCRTLRSLQLLLDR